MGQFLLVLDVPGIKQYVFGTDPLAEIRGASSRLVRLNRDVTRQILQRRLGREQVKEVFANGGTGQFLIEARGREEVEAACDALARQFRQESGGELALAWGLAEFPEGSTYREIVREAHQQLRWQRDLGRGQRVALTAPVITECQSSSHWPAATQLDQPERRLVSRSVELKRDPTARVLWDEWTAALAQEGGWPEKTWEFRCVDFAELTGAADGGGGDLGLVYADGNGMGKLVRELDAAAACREFSRIVDDSIRAACHRALGKVSAPEIERIRAGERCRLPADILLLGGDDLLVALPAARALPFAEGAAREFESETAQRIADLPPGGEAQRFFSNQGVTSLTISCGVAIGKYSYPFALLLDLTEDLLQSAKRGGGFAAPATSGEVRSRIDFHIIQGSTGHDLNRIREEEYQLRRARSNEMEPPRPRTLRPYSLEEWQRLKRGVARLSTCRPAIPRSKLHALREAALLSSPERAQRAVRDLFCRCRPEQRRALIEACSGLGDQEHLSGECFPWVLRGGQWATPLPDLVEALELLKGPSSQEEDS